ncbi:MAG TPA: 16S rRNA (adenine(1518)-N(6)/adenine(1519)-N(6))-dimethyltransferase RsmA [Bellilinea sp.]|nr:16S rRNA (adenine(1518)-N(6)/adenine(1519)-N(6))-dimethyltransferase RsmA [Bellilinea sp.]
MTLSALNVSNLLRNAGLTPRKGLGQNFLTDPMVLDKVVEAAGVSRDDTVLEIGPGLGSLTRHLARAARRVVAVEIDGNLIPILQQVLTSEANVTVVHGNVLELNPAELMDNEPYLVVANIPYYITSAILRHLLDSTHRPQRLVLTVQREVAERICAAPGDMSLLALSVQVYGLPGPVLRIPAGAFYPPPKVDSTTLRVDLFPQPCIPASQLDTFFRLAKAGFSQKRKTLRNALSGGLGWKREQTSHLLQTVGIDPQRRAETLTIDEWAGLTTRFLEEKNIPD